MKISNKKYIHRTIIINELFQPNIISGKPFKQRTKIVIFLRILHSVEKTIYNMKIRNSSFKDHLLIIFMNFKVILSE